MPVNKKTGKKKSKKKFVDGVLIVMCIIVLYSATFIARIGDR